MKRLIMAGFLVSFVVAASYGKLPIVISQEGKVFQPGKIEVEVNDIVMIDNDDRVTHHVYVESPNFNFDSGEQAPGKRVPLKFTERGTFEVMCEIHPKMKLTVNVR